MENLEMVVLIKTTLYIIVSGLAILTIGANVIGHFVSAKIYTKTLKEKISSNKEEIEEIEDTIGNCRKSEDCDRNMTSFKDDTRRELDKIDQNVGGLRVEIQQVHTKIDTTTGEIRKEIRDFMLTNGFSRRKSSGND